MLLSSFLMHCRDRVVSRSGYFVTPVSEFPIDLCDCADAGARRAQAMRRSWHRFSPLPPQNKFPQKGASPLWNPR